MYSTQLGDLDDGCVMGKDVILTLNTPTLTKPLGNDSGLGITKGWMIGIIFQMQTAFKEERNGVQKEKPWCGSKWIICIGRRPSCDLG